MIIRNVNIDSLNTINKHRNGVYMIENKINHKKYIGSAAGKGGFIDRFRHHIFDLDHKKHHSQKLMRAFLKEKSDYSKFKFSILEYCEPEQSIIREQYWIDHYDTYYCGYNSTPVAGSLLNFKKTEQQKRNMSIAKQKMPETIIIAILNDYNDTDLNYSEIGVKYNTSCTIISWIINNPRYYPEIKKKLNFSKKERYKYIFVSPTNKIIKSNNINKFAEKYSLSKASIWQLLSKKVKKLEHKGWLAFHINDFSLEKLQEVRMKNEGKIYKITNGVINCSFSNIPKFCKENNFNETPIYHLLKGRRDTYKGFKVI